MVSIFCIFLQTENCFWSLLCLKVETLVSAIIQHKQGPIGEHFA